MGVDYATLIVPYSEATPPANTAAKRTPEGQKAWLLKRGIPESVVDDAMTAVYTELAAGRVFEAKDGNPAGYWLDRYLLETARETLRGREMARLSIDDYAQVAGDISRSWKDRAIDIGIGAAGALSVAVAAYFLWL